MGKKVTLSPAEQKARLRLQAAKHLEEQQKALSAKAEEKAAVARDKIMARAGPNRQIKMAIASLTKALWNFELTEQQKIDIKNKIALYRKDLKSLRSFPVEKSLIEEHMVFLSSAPELVSVMRVFWVCMMPYVESGKVKKEAFLKLMMNFQYALNGNPDEVLAKEGAQYAWDQENIHYGSMTQEAFYDVVYCTATSWLETFDAMSYCTFLWALIDSLFDTSVYPPKFRTKRFIRCITQKDTEAGMMHAWYASRHHIEEVLEIAVKQAATITVQVPGTGDGTIPAQYETRLDEQLLDKYKYVEGDDARWALQGDPNLELLLRMQKRVQTASLSEEESAMIKAFAISAEKRNAKERQEKEQRRQKLKARGIDMDDLDSDEDVDSDVDPNDNNSLGAESANTQQQQEKLARTMTDSLSTDERFMSSSVYNRKGITVAELFKDGRSGWLEKNRGEGQDRLDVSFNYRRVQFKRIKRSSNWIGQLKGNVFFNRGQYLSGMGNESNSFSAFLQMWMVATGLTDDDITYAMLAAVKAEWLNARSSAQEAALLQGRLDEDRLHLESIHKRADGMGIAGIAQAIYCGTSDVGLESDKSRSTVQSADDERIHMSVKEVMQMIRELQPRQRFGESIPAQHQFARIPDVVLLGSGEVAVEARIPFSTADYTYAPTYAYHQPEHSLQTLSLLGKIRPQHPLRRMLDGGGNYAGTSGHTTSGMHYSYGSHINALSHYDAASRTSFEDGSTLQTTSVETILLPVSPHVRSKLDASSSVRLLPSHATPGHTESRNYQSSVSSALPHHLDDDSQWSTLLGDESHSLAPLANAGMGSPTGLLRGSQGLRYAHVVSGLGREQVHPEAAQKIAIAAAASAAAAAAKTKRHFSTQQQLLQRCKKLIEKQRNEQSSFIQKGTPKTALWTHEDEEFADDLSMSDMASLNWDIGSMSSGVHVPEEMHWDAVDTFLAAPREEVPVAPGVQLVSADESVSQTNSDPYQGSYARSQASLSSLLSAQSREADLIEEALAQRNQLLKSMQKAKAPTAGQAASNNSFKMDSNTLLTPASAMFSRKLPRSQPQMQPTQQPKLILLHQQTPAKVQVAHPPEQPHMQGSSHRLFEEINDDISVGSADSASLGSLSWMTPTPTGVRAAKAGSSSLHAAGRAALYGKGTGGKEYRFMDPQDILLEKVFVSENALTWKKDRKWS